MLKLLFVQLCLASLALSASAPAPGAKGVKRDIAAAAPGSIANLFARDDDFYYNQYPGYAGGYGYYPRADGISPLYYNGGYGGGYGGYGVGLGGYGVGLGGYGIGLGGYGGYSGYGGYGAGGLGAYPNYYGAAAGWPGSYGYNRYGYGGGYGAGGYGLGGYGPGYY